MNFKRLIFLLILCLNFNLSGNAQEWKKFMGEIGDKTLMYEDWVYEDYIATPSSLYYNESVLHSNCPNLL